MQVYTWYTGVRQHAHDDYHTKFLLFEFDLALSNTTHVPTLKRLKDQFYAF
jgi:hypothetical protein